MMQIKVDQNSVNNIKKIVEELGSNIRKELRVAVNKTAKQVGIQASRKLKEEIKAPSKILKKVTRVPKQATEDDLTAKIVLIAGHPIPLKYFGAVQTKAGVKVQVNPRFGKIVVAGAFMTKQKKYKGNVFTRATQKRGPFIRQHGPSPGEVYQKAGIADLAEKVAREQLPKQVQERIRFLTLKAQGKLRGNQK